MGEVNEGLEGVGVVGDVVSGLVEGLGGGLLHGVGNGGLVLEVEVEGATTDAGAVADVVEAGFGVAVPFEESCGRKNQGVAGTGGPFLLAHGVTPVEDGFRSPYKTSMAVSYLGLYRFGLSRWVRGVVFRLPWGEGSGDGHLGSYPGVEWWAGAAIWLEGSVFSSLKPDQVSGQVCSGRQPEARWPKTEPAVCLGGLE